MGGRPLWDETIKLFAEKVHAVTDGEWEQFLELEVELMVCQADALADKYLPLPLRFRPPESRVSHLGFALHPDNGPSGQKWLPLSPDWDRDLDSSLRIAKAAAQEKSADKADKSTDTRDQKEADERALLKRMDDAVKEGKKNRLKQAVALRDIAAELKITTANARRRYHGLRAKYGQPAAGLGHRTVRR